MNISLGFDNNNNNNKRDWKYDYINIRGRRLCEERVRVNRGFPIFRLHIIPPPRSAG